MDHSLLPPPTGAINHRSPKSRHSSCLSTTLLLLTFAFSLAALIVAIDIRKKTHENLNDLNAVKQNVASMASNVVPKSFVAPSLPPRKYQYTRGTCWDFGTVGPIEHQYRLQGIANGWLAPNQYVKLSEQAFGNRILQYCKENQQYCLIAGDNVAFGSTEGGETTLLYAFRQQFENTVLPDGVCPYIQDKDDSSCPAIDAALKTNPIKFTISSFTTLYNVDDIKQAIATKKYAMPFSTPVWTVSYWLPCNDKYAKNDPKCTTPSLLTPCPAEVDSNGATSCLKIEAPFNTMDGEFRSRHAMDLEAGHAMTLVGYNDNFVTKDGFKGGFIMRNTWVDGVYSFDEFHTARARGSHSIAYFMNWISENDEKLLCPNSYNPRSWITCGAGDTTAAKVSDCMSDNNNKAAVAQLSPLLLVCSTHSTACDHSYNKWWAANFTEYFDSLFIACFIGAKTNGNTIVSTTEICLPPQPMDTIATIFNPDTSNIYPNSDDFCGYYFYPYGVYEEAKATFSSGFVNDYQLDFHPQSYAANANQYAAANGIDYYFIHNSTHQQNILPTGADLPNPYPSGPNPYPNNKNDDNHHLITMRASIQQYVRQQKITRRHK